MLEQKKGSDNTVALKHTHTHTHLMQREEEEEVEVVVVAEGAEELHWLEVNWRLVPPALRDQLWNPEPTAQSHSAGLRRRPHRRRCTAQW